MSRTVRISDEVYEAIEEYRSKNQSFQDVIEEMAEDFGLFPAEIKSVSDLETKLKSTYNYEPEETEKVLEALRYVYTGQEQPQSIGFPHAFADYEYEDEIDSLIRLGLIEEEHYTGKYDYGYRTTRTGSELGSSLVRSQINENKEEITRILDSYDEGLLGLILQFGFEKTESGHLSNRGAPLAGKFVPDFWNVPELLDEYSTFRTDLDELGIAVQYDGRCVLPPEFTDFLQTRVEPNDESLLARIEVLQTLLSYNREKLSTRKDILTNLDTASEELLIDVVETFAAEGITSEYRTNQDPPLLIKSGEEFEQRISEEIKELAGLP